MSKELSASPTDRRYRETLVRGTGIHLATKMRLAGNHSGTDFTMTPSIVRSHLLTDGPGIGRKGSLILCNGVAILPPASADQGPYQRVDVAKMVAFTGALSPSPCRGCTA
jgi:hypothetical protein